MRCSHRTDAFLHGPTGTFDKSNRPIQQGIRSFTTRPSPDHDGGSGLREARGLFETALTELGHPRAGSVDGWHGHWSFIDWARNQADRTHTPYAAAQRVLEVIGDVPELWEPGRGPEIMSVLNQWDVNLADRPALDDEIRAYLWSLSADDCPPD
jgi:hypothetical protein